MLRTSCTLGSARSESESARRPRSALAAATGWPAGISTTMRTGLTYPATPMRVSASSPWPASVSAGHQLRAGRPIRIQKSGAVRIAIATPPSVSARRG